MTSTKVTLKNFSNLSLANLKSDFSSGYQNSQSDQKPKTKAKLSNFKTASQSKLTVVENSYNNHNKLLNVCPHETFSLQENKTISPIELNIKFNAANELPRSGPSSTFTFFNECEKSENYKYSGSQIASVIESNAENGFIFDDDQETNEKFIEEKKPYWNRKKVVEKKDEVFDLTQDFDFFGLSLED